MFIEDANIFWSPSQSLTLCSISSDFLLEIVFDSYGTIIIKYIGLLSYEFSSKLTNFYDELRSVPEYC